MTFVKLDEWQSSPGIRLDEKSLEIVKSNASLSILAGPGAGKTELLAQKATFLLTTGLCPPPRCILAIAFKVDAARNLSDRVAERCELLQAQRFESLTLDAFAKRIVDQFLESLPDWLRPSTDYNIIFPNRDTWEDFGNRNSEKCPQIREKNNKQLEQIVHQSIPKIHFEDATTPEQQIRWLWWKQQIDASPSRLTFDMVKLLAIFILRNNENIMSALRHTYSHVFLDEFQDVTRLQYKLIQTAFLDSQAILTAVGDSNQAIMRWAGAQEDIFDQFKKDFGAPCKHLSLNFRSNSRIVELINSLAETFDDNHIPTECSRQDDVVPENAVEVWIFDTRENESEFLASFISAELRKNLNLKPADFVILARIKIDNIEERIKEIFQTQGLKIRNEARKVGEIAIQDLLKERAYSFLLSSIKLAVGVRDGQPFQDCQNTIADVRGHDLNSEKGHSDALYAVQHLIGDIESLIDARKPPMVSGQELVDLIFNHVERKELQRAYREYAGSERLESIISGFEIFFDECRKTTTSWSECIANMEGRDSVRLMTIHKSKGLEYHTVFFVEFNDDSFWGNDDDVNVFFVALSRARERVYFSFTRDSKGHSNVSELYEKLRIAKVPFCK